MKSRSNSESLPALSLSELSYRWGIHTQTIRKFIDSGDLRAIKFERKLVVLGKDWKDFEDKSEFRGKSE